jgi:hypothetical protein
MMRTLIRTLIWTTVGLTALIGVVVCLGPKTPQTRLDDADNPGERRPRPRKLERDGGVPVDMRQLRQRTSQIV